MSELELGPLRFGIIGAGRLGLVLGRALQRSGFELVHVSSRSADARERATHELQVAAHEDVVAVTHGVDCVLLCVPDDALDDVVARVTRRDGDASPRQLRYVTTSAIRGPGALDPLALLGHDTCAMHPVASVGTYDVDPEALRGAAAAIGSSTQAGVTFATALARALQLLPFELGARAWPAHAAACTAAATLVNVQLATALDLADAMGIHEGIARGAYGRLAAATVDRFAHGSATAASASNAIGRGDATALARQLYAVRTHASSREEQFDAALTAAVNDSFSSGVIDIETARRINAAIGAAMNAPLEEHR